jgi:hypothetical protein
MDWSRFIIFSASSPYAVLALRSMTYLNSSIFSRIVIFMKFIEMLISEALNTLLVLRGIKRYTIIHDRSSLLLSSRLGCLQGRCFQHRYNIARQNHIQFNLIIIPRSRSPSNFIVIFVMSKFLHFLIMQIS